MIGQLQRLLCAPGATAGIAKAEIRVAAVFSATHPGNPAFRYRLIFPRAFKAAYSGQTDHLFRNSLTIPNQLSGVANTDWAGGRPLIHLERRSGPGAVVAERLLLASQFEYIAMGQVCLTKIIQLPTPAATAIRQNQTIFREHRDARKVNQTGQLQEVPRRVF
ncbi:hypothetical protein RQP54_06825 [Curvibacter sp. APW13]|uniref:hypothetical protein n=1 Tax=Curvibacter sp. APW13 TaxID=3077236 RepID=UPI0028DF715D|nr:hypothetical protein [Curvibacter sp. APW13]MDT8990577.1 hypothetical protein [Curvibacter sp. APW13]